MGGVEDLDARRHVGMGSSIGSMVAVCIGINEVLGRPFNGRELRRIIGYHSCEESPHGNGYLMPAFETGMGAMVGVNGGWVIGTDDLEMVYRVPLPDTKCIVFIPNVPSLEDEFLGKETAAESEVELLLRRARTLDGLQTGVKAQLVLYDMIPAMIKNDLRGIGNAMFDLTFLGSKRAECEQHGSHGAPIYTYISTFREIGARITSYNVCYTKLLRALHGQKRDLADSLLEGTETAMRVSADDLLELLREAGEK